VKSSWGQWSNELLVWSEDEGIFSGTCDNKFAISACKAFLILPAISKLFTFKSKLE
jgi:hypothetical protein